MDVNDKILWIPKHVNYADLISKSFHVVVNYGNTLVCMSKPQLHGRQ